MENNHTQADVIEKLHDLCARASEAEDGELDRFLEPEYSTVLNYILAHPHCRLEFGQELLRMVNYPGDISAQLVEYCMYELRWPEFEEAVRARLAASEDPRNKAIFEHILEAFQDDWDKEGYERWGNAVG